jgi:hypothetical protein
MLGHLVFSLLTLLFLDLLLMFLLLLFRHLAQLVISRTYL